MKDVLKIVLAIVTWRVWVSIAGVRVSCTRAARRVISGFAPRRSVMPNVNARNPWIATCSAR